MCSANGDIYAVVISNGCFWEFFVESLILFWRKTIMFTTIRRFVASNSTPIDEHYQCQNVSRFLVTIIFFISLFVL